MSDTAISPPVDFVATSPALRGELEDWYTHYTRIIDAKQPNAWVDKFSADGVFAVGTREAIEKTGMWWYTDRGTRLLKERAAYTHGFFWHVPSVLLHTVMNITGVEGSDGAIDVNAAFAIYAADLGGPSQLYVVGHYRDKLVRESGSLRFREHRVIIFGETVPGNMGILL